MNKENCIMSDKYKRIQGATLKIQTKNFYVYKGVNTIGRNKAAVINLKHLNVSQNHALIIIVDDTQHFISDLNSSNGTYLFGTKLSPYKLYELTNDVELKFGDITGAYFKVPNVDNTIHLETESMDTTQNMTQNFYGASTQLIINESSLNQTRPPRMLSCTLNTDVEDIHEAATQVVHPSKIMDNLKKTAQEDPYSIKIVESDIHEAPTQVVDYQQTSTSTIVQDTNETNTKSGSYNGELQKQQEVDIHEMATQVVNFSHNLNTNKLDEENSNSSTQIIEDTHKIENSDPSCNPTEIDESFIRMHKKSNTSSVVEETVIEETVMEDSHIRDVDENSNDSVDFLAMPFGYDRLMCNEETNKNNDKSSIISDSQDIGIRKKRLVRKLSSSQELPQNNKTVYTNIDDRHSQSNVCGKVVDSGSDTEDDLLEQSRKPNRIVNSDAETDIENDNFADDNMQSQDIIKPKILTKKSALSSDSETDLEDNKEKNYCEKKYVAQSGSDTEIEDNVLEESKKQSKIYTSDSQTKIEEKNSNPDSLTRCQDIIKLKILTKKHELNSDSETDLEDDKENEVVLKANSNENTTATDLNDTDCIPATQDAFGDIFMYKDSRISKSNVNSQNVSSEESFRLGLTELMVESAEIVKMDDNLDEVKKDDLNIDETNRNDMKPIDNHNKEILQKDLISSNEENKNISQQNYENEDLIMMSTEKNYAFEKENDDEVSVSKLSGNVKESKENEENSGCKSITSKNANVEKELDEDFYMMATQKINENQPSQAVSTCKEIEEDIYMMPTQNLDESQNQPEFKTPQKKFRFRKKITKSETNNSNDQYDRYIAHTQQINIEDKNDDIYLQATQKLNEEDKPDLYLQPTQDLNLQYDTLNINKEDLYSAPTQQINVNVEEKKLSSFSETTALDTTKNKDDDLYVAAAEAATQPINSKLVREEINKTPVNKSETDLYLLETQDLGLNKILDKNQREENIGDKKTVSCTSNLNLKSKTLKISKDEDEETTALDTTKNKDDLYVAATEVATRSINSNLVREEINKTPVNKSETDLYLLETQDLGPNKILDKNQREDNIGDKNTSNLNLKSRTLKISKDENPYLASTQQVNINIEENLTSNSSKKYHEIKFTEITALNTTKNKDEDLCKAATQQINSKLVSKEITNVTINKPETDLFLQETQDLGFNRDLEKNTNQKEEKIGDTEKEMYEMSTQLINRNEGNSKKSSSTCNAVCVVPDAINFETKRHRVSDLNTSESKRMKKITNDAVETLSQIDAFIKQPLAAVKLLTEISDGSDRVSKNEELKFDQSETMSQTERFVKEPFVSKGKSNKKTLPKKRDFSSHIATSEIINQAQTADRSETLSQIEAFIKKPFEISEENKATKLNKKYNKSEEKSYQGFQKPKVKPIRNSESNQAKSNLAKGESGNSAAEISTSGDKSVNLSHNEQDSVRTDIEKSFALLEAKSTKTRKSQRLTNVAEIKVAVCKNRRSMTTCAIPESSNDKKIKPSIRRSRRRSININNNVLETVSENIKTTSRTKRKLDPVKNKENDSENSESQKPNKILKVNTKSNKHKEEMDTIREEIVEHSAPSTSKATSNTFSSKDSSDFEVVQPEKSNKTLLRTYTRKSKYQTEIDSNVELSTPSASTVIKKCSDSEFSESEKNSNTLKVKMTKGKLKGEVDTTVKFSTPSTSNTKKPKMCSSRKGSTTSSSIDGERDNFNDTVCSTPRRGRRNIQNTTITSPEKGKRKQKPKIVFTMLDSPLLESLIRQLGGSVVDSVESSTVLVTEHVKRSQKLLTAIGQGKPICSPEWIHASKKAHEFLDPWEFILLDKEAEVKWDFSLKESITRSNNDKLLTNYTFQLMVNNAADVLKGAIEACGGKCVPRFSARNTEFFVIVASPENKSKYTKVKKQNPQIIVVEPEAIFDGVLRQDLRLGRHLLT